MTRYRKNKYALGVESEERGEPQILRSELQFSTVEGGKNESDNAEEYGDHKGVAAMLVRIENN